MRVRIRIRMEANEILKKVKRVFDGYISYRKAVLACLVLVVFLLYLAPSLFPKIFSLRPLRPSTSEITDRSLLLRLDRYQEASDNHNVHILGVPWTPEQKSYLPYVGNGYIGVTMDLYSPMYIKSGRGLSMSFPFRPIVSVKLDGGAMKEAIVTEYLTGIVHRLQAWELPGQGVVDVTSQVYAHRMLPALLLQDVKVINPLSKDIQVSVEAAGLGDWADTTTEMTFLRHGDGEHEYMIITGAVQVPVSTFVVAVCLVMPTIVNKLTVKAGMSTSLHIITAVQYSAPISKLEYPKYRDDIKQKALNIIKPALSSSMKKLRQDHSHVWHKLWDTGFGISHSKAEDSINGDLINATLYHVLSQVRAPMHERSTEPQERELITKDLSYAEGCYGGHHTLQAERLWSSLEDIDEVNRVVGLWLVTLDKQGCHQLVRAGADGVMQAMVLSFGSLLFKNQHLEFSLHPQHLHRDYFFRRVSYGNATHLNISVEVQEEDYKAVMYLALDRSDRTYYACDAGCLDQPAQLGAYKTQFPVKLTQPVTAILYITFDKQHILELKDSIHVKEVALAPAHEHHVIALHKHGHKWGGLPTVFWFSIIALIVIFHLFLFKLVVNEYCGNEAKIRYRKFSDF